MAYAYTVRHTRQAHHHSFHKHHSVASVPRYPVEQLTNGPLRRCPYNTRYLLSTLPAMPPTPVLHNRAVTLDYEDFTLYAPYRAGHAGSQASPWRLPPLLAWLPWLLLHRTVRWTRHVSLQRFALLQWTRYRKHFFNMDWPYRGLGSPWYVKNIFNKNWAQLLLASPFFEATLV